MKSTRHIWRGAVQDLYQDTSTGVYSGSLQYNPEPAEETLVQPPASTYVPISSRILVEETDDIAPTIVSQPVSVIEGQGISQQDNNSISTDSQTNDVFQPVKSIISSLGLSAASAPAISEDSQMVYLATGVAIIGILALIFNE
jgi:hypothetical protein